MRRKLAVLVALIGLAVMPLTVFAQDAAPVSSAAAVAAPAPPPECPGGQQPVLTPSGVYVCTAIPLDPSADILGALKAVIALAKAGNWVAAILLGLCLLVWAVRKFGGMLPGKVGLWFKGDVGGIIMAFLGSLTGVLGGAAYLGLPINGTAILGAFLLAFTAMGAWRSVKLLLRKLPESVQKKLDWLFDLLPKDDSSKITDPPAPAAR